MENTAARLPVEKEQLAVIDRKTKPVDREFGELQKRMLEPWRSLDVIEWPSFTQPLPPPRICKLVT